MSASSLIESLSRHDRRSGEGGGVPGSLLEALAAVPDPRARRGVRHRFVVILALAVCAVLAGAKSFEGIAEWSTDLTLPVLEGLGLGRHRPPSESTIRRVLQRVDAHHEPLVRGFRLPGTGNRLSVVDGHAACLRLVRTIDWDLEAWMIANTQVPSTLARRP